jgi:hypothetical protein
MQKSRHFHILPVFCKIIFVISSRSANRALEVLPLGWWQDFTVFDGTTNHASFDTINYPNLELKQLSFHKTHGVSLILMRLVSQFEWFYVLQYGGKIR